METRPISYSISKFPYLLISFIVIIMSCTVTNSNQETYVQTEHDITEIVANELISRYQQTYPNSTAGDVFTKASIESVIRQPKITGIRYYYGLEANQQIVILTGTQLNPVTNTHDDLEQGVLIASPGSRTITLSQAAQFTKNYRINNVNGVRGGFFKLDAVKAVLYDYSDPDTCAGMRFYYGLDNTNTRPLVFRGVAGSATSRGMGDIPGGRIIDMSVPCPTQCGKKNLLNGIE